MRNENLEYQKAYAVVPPKKNPPVYGYKEEEKVYWNAVFILNKIVVKEEYDIMDGNIFHSLATITRDDLLLGIDGKNYVEITEASEDSENYYVKVRVLWNPNKVPSVFKNIEEHYASIFKIEERN